MRVAFEDCSDVEIVHINEPSPIESSAYLLKFDSVHGAPHSASVQEVMSCVSQCMPAAPWKLWVSGCPCRLRIRTAPC